MSTTVLTPNRPVPPAVPAAGLPPDRYRPLRRPVVIWGLPLLPVTYEEALREVDRLIGSGQPNYFITANLHYAMLSHGDARLAEVNRRAAFLLADGMPMVWYSRLLRRRLPQRVAGSDLIYGLCRLARDRGYRVFFLGGAPGVADQAASRLVERYPGLQIAGIEVPPFRPVTPEENHRLVERIRRAAPHILLVALGQPKGELWLAENSASLGVPACVQLGASFDFVAGAVRRAPALLQRTGLEWCYRLLQEPRRMAPRYARNALFLLRAVTRDVARLLQPGVRGN
jgi:N-acetylglucosaminyldiphosphoundecaprenol N-acetyl-beta-D-mannosaminyltransferase